MTVLENLWYGNINPVEQGFFKTEPCKEYLKLYERHQAKLFETLNDEEKAVFEKLHDAWMNIQQLTECEAFVTGFSLAVRLMAEATTRKECSLE